MSAAWDRPPSTTGDTETLLFWCLFGLKLRLSPGKVSERGGRGRQLKDTGSSVKVFSGAWQGAAGGASGAADHLHPPFKCVLALRSEVVDVGFKVEFEDVILVDVFGLRWDGDRVAQQRKAGQRVIVLM